MASFLKGFAKGFMDTKSQGMEDEAKNNLAIERDRDRILTENILRTASEFHKNYPKAVADTRKTFERYQTALQLTGGNQAAAEAIAKDHDLKLNDFDRIIPIMDAFKSQKDYKSTIPDETKAQYETLHGQGLKASEEANRLLANSRQLKGKLQPFEMPALNPQTYTVQNRPTIEIPRADPGLKAQEFVLTHPDRFADSDAALGFINARREEAGLEPYDLNRGQKILRGIQFGAVQDNKRLAQANELARLENPNATPDQLRKRALEMSLGQAPKEMTIGDPAYKSYQKEITDRMMQIAGAQWIPDPMNPGSYTFKFANPARQSDAYAAAFSGQKMLELDIAQAKRPRPVMEYVYGAAIHHKLVDPNKDLPPIAPVPTMGNTQPQSTGPAPQQQQRQPSSTQPQPQVRTSPKEGETGVLGPENEFGAPAGTRVKYGRKPDGGLGWIIVEQPKPAVKK